jgi:hypothetical protein
MRFWLSGPRIMGIRPGVLFRPDELFKKPVSAPAATKTRGGFIYVIRDDRGLLKIGVSNNPNARLVQLKTASAVPLTIAYAGALRCDGFAIEGAVHETLSRYRAQGEWFDCPMDLAVAAIGAAAHRLGEPIASIEPTRIEEVVHGVAMSNQAKIAKPKSGLLPFLIGFFVTGAMALYFVLTSAQSP